MPADDRRSRRRSGRLLAGVVGVAALVLGGHALHGVRVTYDLAAGRWHGAAAASARRLDCLEGQIEAAVPPGSRLSVDPDLGDELWQRSLEMAWGRAQVVPKGEPADLTLTTAAGAPTDACAGPVVSSRPGGLPETSPTAPTTAPARGELGVLDRR